MAVRVLGIDPGTATMGFGIVAVSGTTLVPVAYGVIRTPAGQPAALRLAAIHRDLGELIRRHRPHAMAVERLFLQKNRSSALHVGQARGVALLAAAQAGLPVYEYAPHEVKQAVVGYGWKLNFNGPHGPLYAHFSRVDAWRNSRTMHRAPDVMLAGSGRFRGLQ